MSIPFLEETLEFLNNVDLDEPFQFTTDGVADDFSTSIIRASFVSKEGQRLDMSSADGTIVKTQPGCFQFAVDKLVMRNLEPGTYDFDITSTSLQGHDQALLRGKVKIVRGSGDAVTILVDRITGPNTVNRTTTGVGATPARPGVLVARTERIVVANDGRGPMGFTGGQGNPGEVTIIEPPDPGDSFTLALEGAMA